MENAMEIKSQRFKTTKASILSIGKGTIIQDDCLNALTQFDENSIHAIVTDPPYGIKEYEESELQKLSSGRGGVWRIPPSFDGHVRSPLPRFTALNDREKNKLVTFFSEWAKAVLRVLRPGGHIFIATNSFIAPMLYQSLSNGELEFRGQVIRVVRTLRGGDRPKNAEEEFPGVSSMPRGCYEPWGLFRKPLLAGMTVSDCLREFETGGIRRYANEKPFEDLIFSERTPRVEREIAAHPSLKPQSFLRQLVYTALPLGKGKILDPFMGSGSTIAAANALELESIGIERHLDYFQLACRAIPKLANVSVEEIEDKIGMGQQSLFLNETDSIENNSTNKHIFNYVGAR